MSEDKYCVDCDCHCRNGWEFEGPILMQASSGEAKPRRIVDDGHYCCQPYNREIDVVTGRPIWNDCIPCEEMRKNTVCGPRARLFKLKTKGTTIAGMMVELSELREFKKKVQSIPVLPTGEEPGAKCNHEWRPIRSGVDGVVRDNWCPKCNSFEAIAE